MILLLIFSALVFYYTVKEIRLRKKYAIPRKIKSITSDINFEVLFSDDLNKKIAVMKAIKTRNEWLEKIKQISSNVTKSQSPILNHDRITFKIQQNDVYIDISQQTTIHHKDKNFVRSAVKITASKIDLIQKIIQTGGHPCYTCFWYFYGEFDIENIVEK